ncbi:MAG TPA: SUMF1/EgtB/PvdO family nonheme iron enzyme [Candidatus Hydrogenedentes bacterium]|nr:SUMF1/EgtB/PvdO family nonheme iron enzyme [Candidatus Hydrogenedentota bacterium]
MSRACIFTLAMIPAIAAATTVESVILAVEDLTAAFREQYEEGPAYRDRLRAIDPSSPAGATAFEALAREALTANPLLDFDALLVIKRSVRHLGLVQNWESNSSLPRRGFDNEIAVLSIAGGAASPTTLYRPSSDVFVGDVDLDFDGSRLLFSMPGANGRWQVHEINADGSELRELPLIVESDVDNYDACYLPDGNLIFSSTAPIVGVPCVTGSSHVSNLYRWDRATGHIRRLTFEQDHDWCPEVLEDGRVLYLRWEYSDIPHFVSRILFSMNPDGTTQREWYGSNSYWPNAMFYARPVPGRPTQFVAIVGGHHDVPRMGELVLFDTARGRREADGVVQRIPGRGKRVEPIILDGLVQESWPKFLHPYPLSDKYFLVSAKPTAEALWGIYLVDVFDNMTLLKELDGYALFEPFPLRSRPRPPIIPPASRPNTQTATVYMQDVYVGPGLEGVPRGAVKALRLFTYHFAYHGMGGQINRVGLDGPWDVKRIVGTVPVELDGSALFTVPANTPLSLQPLDDQGQALQLMRSWMTAMPGETLSCVGCHEPQNSAPPSKPSLAARRAPSPIRPWYGPTRGFSFDREVQPVLDRHCVACHDGRDGGPGPDFRRAPPVHPPAPADAYRKGTKFPPSYLALRRYVRTPTMEGDMHLLPPLDFHANTTHLVQVLRKGHHDVALDAESWDRLITWIDLNTPAHGTWREIVGDDLVLPQRDRRRELLARYAPGADDDPEEIPAAESEVARDAGVPNSLSPRERGGVRVDRDMMNLGPPPAIMHAASVIHDHGQDAHATGLREISLGDGVTMTLRRIPAGAFVMGNDEGHADERPARVVEIGAPFWMGACEVTNAQYARFDPAHDSRLENGDFLQFSVEERGYPLNAPEQPAARVSWRDAMAFCDWLNALTGDDFTLPTEAEWEYACRAGTDTPLYFGDCDANFAAHANLADRSLARVDLFAAWGLPFGAIHPWRPAVNKVDDGYRVSAPVGRLAPNAWGLYDMHGNVAEWTSSDYEHNGVGNLKAVRGGSWYDRPERATAAYRLGYAPWQRVYNVGFRVVCRGRATVAVRHEQVK